MKKLFGKRALALLTTMAILVSLVAMLGGLSMTSGAAYEPKRAVTFTVSEGVQQSCFMLQDAWKYAAGQTVTVKGYYNVYEINGDGFNILGTQATTTATDGWVAFEKEYAVPQEGQWKDFGFWQASGKFALADITFTNAKGEVVYDMTTDSNLIGGTYNYSKSAPYALQGMWYLLGCYGTVAETAAVEVVIDPVYTEPYTPKRVMSYTAGGTQIEGKMIITASGSELGTGIETVVKGYYKIENYVAKNTTDHCVQIGSLSPKADCDWTPFELSYTTGDSNWLKLGFWYAQGTLSIADITIENKDGKVIYDMATDAKLVGGTYDAAKQPAQMGMWYIGYYGDKSEISCTVDPVYVAPYEPNRTVSYTVSAGVQQSSFMLEDGFKVAPGKTVKIKGYYKIDSINLETSGGHFGIFDLKAYEVTNGWVPFEATYAVPASGAEWKSFGFWEASGTYALADITFEDAETGTVYYNMATDAELIAGTYDFNATNKYQKQSIWYLLACYGTVDASATVKVEVGAVYVPETYNPNRVISMTTAGTQINGKIYLYNSNLLGSGKKVTAKGYYKVENYTVADANQNPKIISDALGNITADCDWTPFEIEFTTGSGKALDLEFWYTQGTVSFADVTIAEEDGTYIYDMTSDADLVAGTYNVDNWAINQGIWYFGFYGQIDAATYTIGEPVDGGIVVIPPPYDPEVVELPEIPNLIVADKNGYTPNRAFAIIKGVHKSPKVSYALFADETNYAVAGNKYYVFLKYGAGDMNGVEATISINGTVVKTLTADTEAWETLLDENGKPYSFDAVEVDDIVSIVFQVKGEGTGNFAIADFIIADQTGKIVYSLANDKTMHMEGDMRYVTNGYWKGDPYVAENEGPTLMPIQTKVETYKPTVAISMTQNDKKKGTTAEAFLFMRTNNAKFTAGQKYTIKGMILVDIDAGYGAWANASMSWGDSTGAAKIDGGYMLGTNGAWLPFVYPDGSPVTFMGTPEEDWLKINLFKTYGTIALADIQIVDAQGNVVYDMATDEALKALKGDYSGNVVTLGDVFLAALYNNGVGEVIVADAAQENTETSKQIPQFEESVEVPKDEEETCDHDFVDGTCTKCGETDPNYNPGGEGPIEPPAQTGDENMFFVMALGTLAVISLAALTLNKKFHA